MKITDYNINFYIKEQKYLIIFIFWYHSVTHGQCTVYILLIILTRCSFRYEAQILHDSTSCININVYTVHIHSDQRYYTRKLILYEDIRKILYQINYNFVMRINHSLIDSKTKLQSVVCKFWVMLD